jgi:hypothetical protein
MEDVMIAGFSLLELALMYGVPLAVIGFALTLAELGES